MLCHQLLGKEVCFGYVRHPKNYRELVVGDPSSCPIDLWLCCCEPWVLLPPEQAAELLPWYMQWSRDLAAEMHQRRLVRNEAHRTVTFPISHRPCDCATEWRCEPYGACFIHDSCFCPGSGSFPPVKPPRS